MASLKKRPGSQIWQAQFYVTDPATGFLKQVRRSTGHTGRKKALAAAIEFERASQGIIEASTERAQRAKAILAEAVAEIERETFTAQSARKYLSKLLSVATGEELADFTIESWVGEWLRRKARDSSPATMARYKAHLRAFLDWLGDDRARKPLESVTAAIVGKWREVLQDGGRAGKTVQSYTKDLGAVYRSAIREGLVTFNPVSALEPISTDDSQSRKPFEGLEVASLIAAAPCKEWRGLILVAAFTGLRLGDASKLTWQAIDLQAKTITLMPAKTRRKRKVVCIPIQPDLLNYLLSVEIKSDSPDEPVFSTLFKARIGTRGGLSETFVGIMRSAGVDRGRPSKSVDEQGGRAAGRVTYERGFHSLRHTFTSWLRNAGVSEEDRMALTGHSTRDSHAIYSHHDQAVLRDAVAKLPPLFPL